MSFPPQTAHARRRFLIRASVSALTVVLPATGLFAAEPAVSATARKRLLKRIEQLESQAGGHLGFSLRRAHSAILVSHHGGERVMMCSTFKVALAACVLQRVEKGVEILGRQIAIAREDIVSHAPLTELRVGSTMTVAELCAAAITVSDNTAANLLLRSIGGPVALTAFVRASGDHSTRLDRIETELNIPVPGTDWDTTTPDAMTGLLASLLLGTVLRRASRASLMAWMGQASTGLQRLRAGFPGSWPQGDKTGTGPTTSNDIAWFQPPGQSAWLVAAYYSGSAGDMAVQNDVFANVARAVAEFVAAT